MRKKLLIAIIFTSGIILTFFLKNTVLLVGAATQNLATLIANSDGNTKEEVLQLNDKVQERKKRIDEITSKIAEYQQKINAKRKEQASLQNQLSILENRIAKIELEIDQTQEEIETTSLEIQALDIQIKEKETQINREKQQIAEGIRQINAADQRNRLEILLLNNSFSDFFQEIAELESIYSNLGISVSRLKALQAELQLKRETSDSKRVSLEKLKSKLEEDRLEFIDSQNVKEDLLLTTRLSSQKFQESVSSLRREQAQADDELVKIEGALRDKLKNSDLAVSPDQVILSWPVDPSRGISTYFYDPEYPFRYIFEHPGIDIRAYQGTPIKAAASGYIAKVRNGGIKGYSYIMLVHGGNISTVYGHLSRLDVIQDTFVERGQVIGLVGGKPGTPGAGPLTTGPHLHFETRLNGVPVDPLKYLIR